MSHVNCCIHGPTSPAIVCQHLVSGGTTEYLGWVQAEYDPADPQPGDLMAWCNACHEAYAKEGDWTDDNEPFAAFRVVCTQCFLAMSDAQGKMRSSRQ